MSDSLINNLRKGKNCEKKKGGAEGERTFLTLMSCFTHWWCRLGAVSHDGTLAFGLIYIEYFLN